VPRSSRRRFGDFRVGLLGKDPLAPAFLGHLPLGHDEFPVDAMWANAGEPVDALAFLTGPRLSYSSPSMSDGALRDGEED
jgi:hypothetical protein